METNLSSKKQIPASQEQISMKEYDEATLKVNTYQDIFMLFLILGHWPLAVLLIPYAYGTQIFGLLFGTAACVIAVGAYFLLKNTMLLRVINGQLLMIFSAIFIAQQFGESEMHFHVFVSLAFLLLYKNWKPIVFASISIITQHIIFYYFQVYNVQLFGTPLAFFRNYAYGLEIVFWHAFWVIFEAGILIYIGKKSQDQIEFNRVLMQKQAETSEELMKEREKALNNFLKVSNQGIFSFDKSLTIDWGYSQECEDILGVKDLEGRSIPDLFYTNQTKQEEFQRTFELYFQSKIKPDVAFRFLDDKISILDNSGNRKRLSIDYKALEDAKIICTMTDESEKEELKAKLSAEKKVQESLMKVVVNTKYFKSLLREAEVIFARFQEIISEKDMKSPGTASLEHLFFAVHDFKANLSFFGFDKSNQFAFELESFFSSLNGHFDLERFKTMAKKIQKSFKEELDLFKEKLGEEWIESINTLSIPVPRAIEITEMFKKKYPKDTQMMESIKSLREVPAKNIFRRFTEIAQQLAEKLGKKINKVKIEGGDIKLLVDIFEPLANVLVHMIRNMLDHGIETPEERINKGKEESGNISIAIKEVDTNGKTYYDLNFSDDGRGIDLENLKQAARERGDITNSAQIFDAELLKILFSPKISTRKETSEISGRGVGLSSIAKEVKNLGGDIQVRTKKDKGTSFMIRIPK